MSPALLQKMNTAAAWIEKLPASKLGMRNMATGRPPTKLHMTYLAKQCLALLCNSGST
jgi:hypothetical protein